MIKKPKHLINKQLQALLEEESNQIANLSNASALLYDFLENVNWVGFYLWNNMDNELILGPFQGKVACVRIKNGNGVCGTAFNNEETIVVDDVHQFPGHIVCDSVSQSEIVIPIRQSGTLFGVLDIDSPSLERFSSEDRVLLEEFSEILSSFL